MQLLGRKSKLVFTHDSHVEVIIYLYGLTGNQPVILMHFGLNSIPPLRCRSASVESPGHKFSLFASTEFKHWNYSRLSAQLLTYCRLLKRMRQNNRLNYYVKKWMVHLKSSLFSEGSKIIGKNLFGRVTADWKINVMNV